MCVMRNVFGPGMGEEPVKRGSKESGAKCFGPPLLKALNLMHFFCHFPRDPVLWTALF